mgnify:CR=1 FL=1
MSHGNPRSSTSAGDTTDTAVNGGRRLPWHLDRGRLAAIVQQVPSESYHLTMRRRDAATGQMRWQVGELGDVDGYEVLALIDRGDACLHLRDIDGILDHLDIAIADAPIAPPANHRLRHGLMLVSPRARACPHSTEGEGAIRILAGRAVLLPEPPEMLTMRRDQIVVLEAGAVVPWHRGQAPVLEAGCETLVALTYEALPSKRFGDLRGAMVRATAPLRRSLGVCSVGGSDAAAEFRLVRGPRIRGFG